MSNRALLVSAVLAACGGTVVGSSSTPAAEPRPPLLASLEGKWVMIGDVLGEPFECRLDVQPVLGGAFTELHMTDVQTPSDYEARVFIGHEEKSDVVIVGRIGRLEALCRVRHRTPRAGALAASGGGQAARRERPGSAS